MCLCGIGSVGVVPKHAQDLWSGSTDPWVSLGLWKVAFLIQADVQLQIAMATRAHANCVSMCFPSAALVIVGERFSSNRIQQRECSRRRELLAGVWRKCLQEKAVCKSASVILKCTLISCDKSVLIDGI